MFSIRCLEHAEAILGDTSEREAIKIAVHEVLPKDGSVFNRIELIDLVHEQVDPIHSLLKTSSESYTGLKRSGERRTDAIDATTQWFGKGSSAKQNGNWWVERVDGTIRYIDDGALKATNYFASPKFLMKVEAVRFMNWHLKTSS